MKKVAADGTHRYFYDGQLLVYEHITQQDGAIVEIDYVWGKDISGTRDGACGIGGLLYLKRNGIFYIPFFDAYGNVLGYTDAQGNIVAEYAYDPFGKIVGKSGVMSDDFAFRFSTKYYDIELDLYYYTYRYYNPQLMRWLTEDPIAEDGGLNLYGFCGNNPVCRYDKDGRAYFALRKLKGFVWLGLISHNPLFDVLNIEIAHELVFLEDKGSINDYGYSNLGVGQESPSDLTSMTYYKTDGGYNDCVMRKAIGQVSFSGHNYSVFWFAGHIKKCNCQDYCSALRRKYAELIKDKKVRCECGLN